MHSASNNKMCIPSIYIILYYIQALTNTMHIATAHTYYIPLDTHCEIMLYSYVHVYECCLTVAHHILEVYHVCIYILNA